MRKMVAIILVFALSNCTAVGNTYENAPDGVANMVEIVSASPNWYCGQEWVSLRAMGRVTINVFTGLLGFAGVKIPDQCAAYYDALEEAMAMLEAEEMILREGLIQPEAL